MLWKECLASLDQQSFAKVKIPRGTADNVGVVVEALVLEVRHFVCRARRPPHNLKRNSGIWGPSACIPLFHIPPGEYPIGLPSGVDLPHLTVPGRG